ncbi:Mo25 family protein [Psychroflexus sp. CAK57W]|uniref:Mo25 family protein n=1 Tax=Psychroflexus curvus TaxID=2873595 RepID=UPI001CCC3FD6|nr:Mo25 family protein [Psychroflexus curvus]MBZ9786704.1 Mo25 family protein [Psychroflexus curvus]
MSKKIFNIIKIFVANQPILKIESQSFTSREPAFVPLAGRPACVSLGQTGFAKKKRKAT